jgi:hypothetical protein
MKLHGCLRSGAAHQVGIALSPKGVSVGHVSQAEASL